MIALVLAGIVTAGPTRVVVYPDRAQVSRTTEISCGARVAVAFDHIPPAAAADSFRAEVAGGSIDGLRSELMTLEAEFNPRIEALRKQADELKEKSDVLRDEITKAQTRAQVGTHFDDVASSFVSREMTSEKPDFKAWATAYEQGLSAQLASTRVTADAELKLAELSVEEELIRTQINAASAGAQRRAWSVEVLASCPAGSKGVVTLTYLVGGVSWTPAYEARANIGGSTVELSLWSTIQQTTGEPWEGVELVLSTAAPAQNATPPELRKLFVNATQHEEEKKVLTARSEVIEETRSGSFSGRTNSAAPGGLAVADQGLSVQLVVPEKARVSGDGKPSRLFVGKASLRGTLELRATPKLLPAAFRVAELTNEAPWPILPGPIEAYRGTGFVGRYALEAVPRGGTFTLTFGLEETVRVKRTTLTELRRNEGLFNDKVRFSYDYNFEVGNYGKQPVELTLIDQVPVAEVNDLSVSLTKETTPGFERSAKDGTVKWKLKLNAQEKKQLVFGFVVDVPSSYDTGGL